MKKFTQKLGKRITAMALVLLMLASSGGASVFAEVAASPTPTAAAETQATPVPEDTSATATEPTPTEAPVPTEAPAPTEEPTPTEDPAAAEPAATQEPTEATPEPDQQPTPEPTEEAAATEQPAATPTEEPAPTASPDPTAAPADNGVAMMNESTEETTAAVEPAAASQVKLVDIALGDNLDFKLTDSDGNPLTSIGKGQEFKISIEYVIDNLHIGEISADTQIFYEFPEMLDMDLATDKDDITMPGYGIAGSYTLSQNQETQKWELVFSFNEEFLNSRTNIEGTFNWDCKLDTDWWEENETQNVNFGGEGHDVTIKIPDIVMVAEKTYNASKVTETGRIPFTIVLNTQGKDVKDVRVVDTLGAAFSWPSDVQISLDGNTGILKKVDKDPADLALHEYCTHDQVATINLGDLEAGTYTLTYEAVVNDRMDAIDPGTNTNKVEWHWNGKDEDDTIKVEWTDSTENLTKTGSEVKTDEDGSKYIEWTIDINGTLPRMDLAGATLTDTLSTDATGAKQAVKNITLQYQKDDGTWEPVPNAINPEENGNWSYTFPNENGENTRHYQVVYRTTLDDSQVKDGNYTSTNRVDLELENEEDYTDSAAVEWGVSNAISVRLTGTKTMANNISAPAGTEFTFELYEGKVENFETATLIDTQKTDADGGDIVFQGLEQLKFTDAETKTFTIREVADSRTDIGYDPAIWDVTVAVTKNPNGSLNRVITYTKRGTNETSKTGFSFENTYLKTTLDLPVVKKLAVNGGTTKLPDKVEFKFTLTNNADSNEKYTGTATIRKNAIAENAAVSDITWENLPVYSGISPNTTKTYTYTLAEESSTVSGVTIAGPYTVEVTVTADGKGAPSVDRIVIKASNGTEVYDSADTPTDDFTIENTYKENTFTITGDKTLTGADLEDHYSKFSFTVESVNAYGEPITADTDGAKYLGKWTTIKADKTGQINFPTFTVTESGTYYLLVTENELNNNNIVVDQTQYLVTVTVNNNLEATVSYSKREDASRLWTPVSGDADADFANIYRGKDIGTGVTFEGEKTENGVKATRTYKFKLERYLNGERDTSFAAKTITATNGDISFNGSQFGSFNKNDVGNTYYYRLYEDSSAGTPGVVYDDQEYWFAVRVTTYSDDGTLKLEIAKVTGKNAPVNESAWQEIKEGAPISFTGLNFENKYYEGSTTIPGTKTVTAVDGTNKPSPSKFTMRLQEVDAQGKVLDGGVTTQPDDNGNFTFTLTYYGPRNEKETRYYMVTEDPGNAQGVTYADNEYYIIVEVENKSNTADNRLDVTWSPAVLQNGTIVKYTAVEKDNFLAFENKYSEVTTSFTVSGTKTVEYIYNPHKVTFDETKFTFVLEEFKNGAWSKVTSVHANADGTYTLSSGDLTYYTETDSPHLFRVREKASGIPGITDDTTCYQIAVTVTRDEDDGYTLTTSKTIQKGTYDADGDFVPDEDAANVTFDTTATNANFTNKFNDNDIPPVVTLDKTKGTQSYLDGTIEWSVKVDLSEVNAAEGNQPGQTLQDFTFTDTVSDTGGNASHPADTTLVEDVAVTCKTHGADCPALKNATISYGEDGKTFTIAFGDVTGPHIFIVTYTTKTQPTTEGDNLGQATNDTDITVTNTSSVTYTFGNERKTVTDKETATFKDIFTKQGVQERVPVAGDSAKTAIKWTIDLDLSVLANVTGETVFTITDTLPEGLRYMEGKTTLEQVDTGETREVEPTDPDSSTLVWNLTGLTSAKYQLVYYTEVTGDVYDENDPSASVDLTNNAILNQGDTPLGDATDTVKVENKLLSKESEEYTTTGGAKIGLTYTIKVNQDGLDLLPGSDDILTLRDQLPDNATVPTSVTFYRGNTNTLVSDASWRIETENGHNVLVCTLPDETYVRIVYTQVVNNEQPNKPVTLKNTATLTGSYTITAGEERTIIYAEGSATATGTAGTVSLTKKDSTNVNTRLPGAEFTLYKVEVDNLSSPEENADGIPKNPIVKAVTKVETVTSNANGVAVFGEGDSGTLAFDTLYYYEETKAPAGYQRNTQRTYFILPSQYTPDQLKTYVGYILENNSDGEYADELPASAGDVNYPAVTYPSYDVFDSKLESDVQFTVSKQFYGTNASKKSFAFELLNANADGSVNNASGGTTEKVSDETIIRADENGLIPSGTEISIPLDPQQGAGTDSFPRIEYEPVFTESKDGGYDPITYYYLIREKDGNKGDAGEAENGELITVNDASVYLVEVKLEYDEAAEPGGVKETVTMTWMYDGDGNGSYTDDEKQTITPETGKQPVAAFYNNELQLYSLDGNFVEIQGHKYVKSAVDDTTPRNAEEGEFRFNLYRYNGDNLASYADETPLATATTDENGNFVFYYSMRDTSQTIELAVVEQNAGKTIDGISYTDQVAKVTLSAKNFADNETPVFAGNFVNTAVLEIEVTKEWAGDEEITDTHPEVRVRLMRSTEGEEPQAVATVTLNEENDWKASFGTQPYFDSEGNKYIYTVEEVPAEGLTPENPLPGYTASVALSTGEPQSGDASDASYVYRFTVTNTFNGAGVVFIDPQITKRVVTADGTDEQVGIAITPNAFKFDLKDENGRVIASAYNDADGNVRFDSADTEELRFDEEDVGKTFRYTIEEDPTYNHDPNYVYDETVVTVEITISRNAEDPSHLEANLTYYEDGQQTETPELVNTWYPIILRVQKTSKDGSNDPLVGAIYGLWRVSGAANGEDLYLGNCVADENGYMTFYEGVEVGGTYYFKEEFAPDGHTVDEYPSKTFTIREAEDGSGYYLEYQDSNRLAKNAPAPEQSEVATVDETAQGIVLEYKDGAVGVQDEVTKLYVNKLDTNTREPVTGAVLQIIEKDTGTVVYQWTSGETTQGMERVLNVDTTYILREVTAPDGYDKAEDTEFIFDAYGNLTVLSGADAEWVGDTTINLYNTKRDVTITRQVTDEVVRQVRQVAHVVRTIPQTGDGAPIVLVASLSLCGVLLIVYLQERKRANRKDR
ncbi:Spy0128 family protein [uncultured Subdoligranulum sp.]|uniref:Spy0128 family protein n=1 Tax=uncultured Subdoligranulum sp. TaxID=512298 RepID=UPI0025D6F2EC|nr:FctA domain-containing protein [uncultured Subdoligranulum sp.]